VINEMNLADLLAKVLEPWEARLVPRSYDIVGDIAVIRVPRQIEHRAKEIAEAIMQSNKHVKTVLHQVGPVSGELRLRRLRWLAGEKRTETIHKEAGCIFKVDLEKCYFSPRLSYERMRIAEQVEPGEVVVNMFAGVGCFSIVISKHSKVERVYSIDINPDAVRYAEENVKLNRLYGVIEVLWGDARNIVQERLWNVADRVLMPLPEKAYEYLEYGLLSLKPGGKGIVHYYDFAHAGKGENPVDIVAAKVLSKLESFGVNFDFAYGRTVRAVGPRWFQVVLDIRIRKML
jgi:tRNA (guanine37-N1)-methyltransferase